MGFSIETSVPAMTVFLQGLLSFFSPCVLPLVPLYVSYLAGGTRTVDEDGNIRYPRKKVLINTVFFVIGVSFAFFLLGLGVTALGKFFSDNQLWFARVSGIIMVVFGLYQFGFFGKSKTLGSEHRLTFQLDKWTMGPIPALLLGFTFSFAWTPCVGPALGSVLLMAGSSGQSTTGFLLIGVYTLGFIIPFLAVGMFTGTVLNFFKQHQNVVRYTVKVGAVLLIIMGIMTFTGFVNGITGYLSGTQGTSTEKQQTTGSGNQSGRKNQTETKDNKDDTDKSSDNGKTNESDQSGESKETEKSPALDFTLKDQFGNEHKLSDYKGKTVFLNFWATWCPPCRQEMPEIQELYEKYGENKEDLVVLGLASPNFGNEGSEAEISSFLEENNYTFPVVMDEGGSISSGYGIRAFPTTFMIDKNGNVYGYAEGGLTGKIMENIVKQTMEGK